MQASIARHEKLFSLHDVLSQIHIKKDDFASSNSTKYVMYKSVQAHKQISGTIKSQSHNAEKHKFFSKKMVCTSNLQSTFDTNAKEILKTLFDNLRSNLNSSGKTKNKTFWKCHFCSGSLWKRLLSEIRSFGNFIEKINFNLLSNKEIKNFAFIQPFRNNS